MSSNYEGESGNESVGTTRYVPVVRCNSPEMIETLDNMREFHEDLYRDSLSRDSLRRSGPSYKGHEPGEESFIAFLEDLEKNLDKPYIGAEDGTIFMRNPNYNIMPNYENEVVGLEM